MIGTPEYTSPEAIRGAGSRDVHHPKAAYPIPGSFQVPHADEVDAPHWLRKVFGLRPKTCKDASGRTYVSVRGCAKGHERL